MKFFISVVAALTSVASAASLRKSAEAISKEAPGEESFGSRVQIGGLLHVPTKDGEVYEALDGRATGVQVSVVGIKTEPSDDEIKFLESAVVDAHNDAFSKIGYALTEFEVISLLPYDTTNGAFLVIGTATPVLKGEDIPELSVAAYIHQAFDSAICYQLKHSGLEVFSGVHDCTFNFVYDYANKDPVNEATMAKEDTSTKTGDVVSAVVV